MHNVIVRPHPKIWFRRVRNWIPFSIKFDNDKLFCVIGKLYRIWPQNRTHTVSEPSRARKMYAIDSVCVCARIIFVICMPKKFVPSGHLLFHNCIELCKTFEIAETTRRQNFAKEYFLLSLLSPFENTMKWVIKESYYVVGIFSWKFEYGKYFRSVGDIVFKI